MGWILRHRSQPTLSACLVALLGAAPAGAAEPRVWPIAEAHTSNITGVAFSPDGRTLATSSLDGTAKLWDLVRGRPRITTLKDESGAGANSVTFSPDGSILATGHWSPAGRPGKIWLWDAATGTPRRSIATTGGRALCVAFSRDGRKLGEVADDAPARTWDVADGRMLTETNLPARSGPVAFAPDLATLAAAADDRSTRLIEVATGREVATLTGLPKRPLALAFSPDGKALACGTGAPMMLSNMGPRDFEAGVTKVWDLSGDTPRERTTLTGLAHWVGPITFSPDGASIVTSGTGGGAIVWDVATGSRRATLQGPAISFAFAPDGKTLAGAGPRPGFTLWDTETWAASTRFEGRGATRIAFLPDGKTLAVGFSDGTVALRDPADGRTRLVLQAGPSVENGVTALAVARDGALIAAGLGRGGIRLWDPNSGASREGLGYRDLGEVTAQAFAPDGKALASGEKEGTIRLWGLTPNGGGPPLRGHEGRVVGLAFAPDGKTLASAGADGTLRLWDVGARRERASIPVHTARVPKMKHEQMVRFGQTVTTASPIPGEFEDRPIPLGSMALSPDGSTIATGDAGFFTNSDKVSLRDAATGRERLAFKPGLEDLAGNVNVVAMAFSPDGQWLASAGYGTIRISDAATGRERLTFTRPGSGPIRDLAFAPDGRSLAACGMHSIWLWDLPTP